MAEETLGDVVQIGGNAQARLVSFVERAERMLEEIATAREDLKEIFAEAKGEGFDTKTMRKAIRWRAADKAKLAEEEALLDTYLHALGDR